ncbi:hypothetical protein Hanom_Chr16g01509101 [Helianthus anomalus]
MKMARFQTFWIQMRKNKPLDESRKSGQTSGTKMALYSNTNLTLGTIMFIECRKLLHVLLMRVVAQDPSTQSVN